VKISFQADHEIADRNSSKIKRVSHDELIRVMKEQKELSFFS
jgi:hypothetical protein